MVHHYRGQRLKTPAHPAGSTRPGYGFVSFTTPDAAQKALTALDGSELGNQKSLRAHFAGFGTIQSAMVHHYRGQRLKTPSPAHPTGTPAQPTYEYTPRPGLKKILFSQVEVESTLHHLDKEDIGAQIRSQCFSLQGSIDAYFRRNDGADKRSACAKIMTDIGAIEENLKRYDDEDDMKARLVTQLILMEDTLGKFLRPDRTGDEARPDNGGGPEARKSDDSLSSASIQARIKSIDEAKTLFLTNEIKEERDTRLARVRQRLKHVLHEQDARQLLRSVYIELRDR
ncbi:uncharacterized protein LOC103516805 [Diaphorina citri]|uniref:Uncharacterized protein LOC103516805 n=1 Tax=Diaphorina citri TaxID=121845 RepID=A0A3Q0J904_DIACI|nr:uncharacterized protein LOC103516805 [Diaphorina citri]